MMFEHLFFRVSGGLGFFLANIGRSGFSFTEHRAVPVFNKVKIRAGGRTFQVTIKVHEVLKSQERKQKLISHKFWKKMLSNCCVVIILGQGLLHR